MFWLSCPKKFFSHIFYFSHENGNDLVLLISVPESVISQALNKVPDHEVVIEGWVGDLFLKHYLKFSLHTDNYQLIKCTHVITEYVKHLWK